MPLYSHCNGTLTLPVAPIFIAWYSTVLQVGACVKLFLRGVWLTCQVRRFQFGHDLTALTTCEV